MNGDNSDNSGFLLRSTKLIPGVMQLPLTTSSCLALNSLCDQPTMLVTLIWTLCIFTRQIHRPHTCKALLTLIQRAQRILSECRYRHSNNNNKPASTQHTNRHPSWPLLLNTAETGCLHFPSPHVD